MAVTEFQRTICRLLAANRLERGESYVAGGTALNLLAGGARLSRDIDLFHDTTEALEAAWDADRRLLAANGYEIRIVRERPAYVEAVVSRGDDRVLMEWARDSAFRFFPLAAEQRSRVFTAPAAGRAFSGLDDQRVGPAQAGKAEKIGN